MAKKTELKLTKKQKSQVVQIAGTMKIEPTELEVKINTAVKLRDIDVDEALKEIKNAINNPGTAMPWVDSDADKAPAAEEEEGKPSEGSDQEEKTLLAVLAEELEIPSEDLKAKLEGMQVTANLSLEGAEEGDVTALLGLVAQTQEDHEALKADFEHLLTWAHRRGYIKE